jgi:2'-5' RNA ligase
VDSSSLFDVHSVVSLLDEIHYHKVTELWAEISRRFGIRERSDDPLPHISYHVDMDRYDAARLIPLISEFAESNTTFSVKTEGIGVFTGQDPVPYITVVRTPELSRFQLELWNALKPVSSRPHPYMDPRRWIPHITLSQNWIKAEEMPRVLAYLSTLDFNWEIPINHLSLTYFPQRISDSRLCFDLRPSA